MTNICIHRLVINLAKEINAPELLPSALYDLSRSSPSEIAAGMVSTDRSKAQFLADDDLMSTLSGREHASRFLSTFVVHELICRNVSGSCLYRNEQDRICQTAFETITFEILRDVNGIVCQRTSDPLFAIMDAELMQNRSDWGNARSNFLHRACESCRMEFTLSADNNREEMWSKLPVWFNVDLLSWP